VKETSTKYMNPYLAGVLLGLVLLLTMYLSGRGLGASGAVKDVVVATVKQVTPESFAQQQFYQDYASKNPIGMLNSWLFFEVLGVFIGAFFSGIIAGRNSFTFEKPPAVKNKARIIGAVVGGVLFGFGSQLGRGCTSGSALSGMAVMSLGGIVTMAAIFGGAYAVAIFFRKLWVR